MTTNYDPHKYASLLVDYLPGVIQTEEENDKALEFAGRLMRKGDKRSPEETRLLDLLVTLIEDFEEKAYPMGESVRPVDTLCSLMEEHKLKQTDMLDIFGSQGVVSQVLNGKREISKAQARRLSERFRLPVDIFI
jgi:HTH-type transcriptional regulator/antitoxin HigA